MSSETERADSSLMFLKSLEKWLEGMVMKSDELGREERIKRIGHRYRQVIQANIEYFQIMKKNAEENGSDGSMVNRYGLMAEAYQTLLKGG
jgi:hypothetical protein